MAESCYFYDSDKKNYWYAALWKVRLVLQSNYHSQTNNRLYLANTACHIQHLLIECLCVRQFYCVGKTRLPVVQVLCHIRAFVWWLCLAVPIHKFFSHPLSSWLGLTGATRVCFLCCNWKSILYDFGPHWSGSSVEGVLCGVGVGVLGGFVLEWLIESWNFCLI